MNKRFWESKGGHEAKNEFVSLQCRFYWLIHQSNNISVESHYHFFMFSKSFLLNTNQTFQYSHLSLWIIWCSIISPKSSWAKPEPTLESHLSVFDHELNSKHFFFTKVGISSSPCMCQIYLFNIGGTLSEAVAFHDLPMRSLHY